jgi:hypothetical protein
MADGIQGGQHVVTLAAGGPGYQEADQTPEVTEEGPEDEVRGIDEQDRALAPFGLPQAGLEFGLQEVCLLLRVRLGRDRPDLAPAQAESFFKKARTWVRPRRMPVWRSMAAWASRLERGGFSRK